MKEFAESFYKSTAWKNCRQAYASSRRGLCERCLQRGIYTPGVIVHHKVHITPNNITDPDIVLNWQNLELLCRECHAKEHGAVHKRFTIDERGRVFSRE